MLTDIELMRLEVEVMWDRDARGRLTTVGGRRGGPAPHLVIAAATDGQRAVIGSEVPDALADQLRALIDDKARSADLSTPPAAIATCMQLLAPAVGPVELASGPSFWIPPATRFASVAEIVRSDRQNVEPLGAALPVPANWTSEEWRELMDGSLGPWAAAVGNAQVVALCHSSRLSDQAATAGVWTAPDHRGKGLAAAVTAAWSSLFSRDDRHLFYSTSADNASSQNVTKRLDLRTIGWTWQLSTPKSA